MDLALFQISARDLPVVEFGVEEFVDLGAELTEPWGSAGEVEEGFVGGDDGRVVRIVGEGGEGVVDAVGGRLGVWCVR